MNNGLPQRCAFCNADLSDRKPGTKYCSDAHRKRYERMDEGDKVYPREVAPGLREQRCNVHGELFTEHWLGGIYNVWHPLDGCPQCKRLVAIRPAVEQAMKDRRLELMRRVDAEVQRRDADLQKMIQTALEGQREAITKDMTLVLRGAIRSDLESEMEQEITAELLEQEVTA